MEPTISELNGTQELYDELELIKKTLNSKATLSDTEKLLLKITNCLYNILDNLDDRLIECESQINILENNGHF